MGIIFPKAGTEVPPRLSNQRRDRQEVRGLTVPEQPNFLHMRLVSWYLQSYFHADLEGSLIKKKIKKNHNMNRTKILHSFVLETQQLFEDKSGFQDTWQHLD